MDDKELYWLAGLLEGEGSFMKPSPSVPNCPRIVLDMTDEDVVLRAAKLFSINYVYKSPIRKENWKQSYKIQVKGKNAIRIMSELYPLMGERRKQQIETAIGEKPTTEFAPTEENWFYWIVGLLEGEGAFLEAPEEKATKVAICFTSTDKDVAVRLAEKLKARCYGPYKIASNSPAYYKLRYMIRLEHTRALELMQQLRPHMSQRRQQQIDRAVATYQFIGHPHGATHPQAKLDADKVREIRQRITAGEKQSHLALEYGVDTGLIWQIKSRRIWQDID